MNIEKLAKAAGLRGYQEKAPGIDGAVGNWDELAKFALLVAAHEREECAKVCEVLKPFGPELALQKATAEDCAAAIRARGKA